MGSAGTVDNMPGASRSSARRRKGLIASAVLALLPLAAAQAGSTTAPIDKIRMISALNIVYVYPAGGIASPASCQTAGGQAYYSFSMARPMAKEYFAALLAAHARGTPVALVGTGTCQDESVSETLDSISLN